MKLRSILLLSAAFLFAVACDPREIIPEIVVPIDEMPIFTTGMEFDSGSEGSGTPSKEQSQVVTFTANGNWATSVEETTKAPGWLSLDPSSGVAGLVNMTVTVQPNTGSSPRSAVVTITCGTVSIGFIVSQDGYDQPVVPVTSVALDKTSLDLTKGGTATLTATVAPDNATDKTVTWTTNDASVATVKDGVVTAVGVGAASITATAGDKNASCAVVVKEAVIEVTSVTLDKTSLSLEEGQTETLAATVLPENATDKTVTWSSSDAAVATVADGVVTAVAEGTAVITAKAGDKTATCQVSVRKKEIPVTSVSLDKTAITLQEGESETLTATVEPENATDKTVTWSSSDAAVATVADGVVTAVSEGTATITAKAGDKEATCAVTVLNGEVPVASVALDKTSLTMMMGEIETLTATVLPDNATDKTVTWISSNPAVATVVDGVVTAVAEGFSTITAKAGDKTATCNVMVMGYVFGISPISVDVSGDGDTFTVEVVCTVNYRISSMPDWITEESVEDNVHTFKVAPNPASEARSGVIEFKDIRGTTQSCTVNQGKPSPDNTEGGTEDVGVDDDINWE